MKASMAFLPAADCSAYENIKSLIIHCRALNPFEGTHDFDSLTWSLGISTNSRARRESRTISFVKLTLSGRKRSLQPLHADFSPFAKAMVTYFQISQPVLTSGVDIRLKALQALECALLKSQYSCPTALRGETFNYALSILSKLVGPEYLYRAGQTLERFAAFLDKNRLTAVRCSWRNFAPPPEGHHNKLGEQYEAAKKRKLPKSEHLQAIGLAFHGARKPCDIVATSAVALLLCQPSRISEVICLTLNCLVPRADGKAGVLLRWFPSKGGTPTLKPVPTTMTDIATEAVARLTATSQPARKIAEFYEDNPKKIYLDDKREKLRRKRLLSCREAGYILWGDLFDVNPATGKAADDIEKLRSVLTWLRRHEVPIPVGQAYCRSHKASALDIPRVPFTNLQRVILKMLPQDFPIFDKCSNVRYSETIFVVRANELSLHSRPLACVIVPVQPHHIGRHLLPNAEHGTSLYSRTGVPKELYEQIRLTSHQARHFLDTLANSANLDSFDISSWAGRKSREQNTVYDHVSATERAVEMGPSVLKAMEVAAPRSTLQQYAPVNRHDFDKQSIRTGHVTDLGFCAHDFSVAPCGKFAEHITCDEHFIVKGNEQHELNLRTSLAENRRLKIISQRELMRGNLSARSWLEAHEKRVSLIQGLIALLEDPNIENGTVLKLSQADFYTRISKPIPALDAR